MKRVIFFIFSILLSLSIKSMNNHEPRTYKTVRVFCGGMCEQRVQNDDEKTVDCEPIECTERGVKLTACCMVSDLIFHFLGVHGIHIVPFL